MSLSFVSSTVQRGTEDGGYEETPIETSKEEREAVNRRNANKPLYEQLRDNQDEEQAKWDELQREMMRGTRALDEDDVAHLDALERQRSERERAIQEQTQSELAMFRAAKAMRQQQVINEDEDDSEDNDDAAADKVQAGNSLAVSCDPAFSSLQQSIVTPKVNVAPPTVPKIKIVKRRKRKAEEDVLNRKVVNEKGGNEEGTMGCGTEKLSATTAPTVDDSKVSAISGGGLSSLLAGYGSSSDGD
jgi:hypothetical protein